MLKNEHGAITWSPGFSTGEKQSHGVLEGTIGGPWSDSTCKIFQNITFFSNDGGPLDALEPGWRPLDQKRLKTQHCVLSASATAPVYWLLLCKEVSPVPPVHPQR